MSKFVGAIEEALQQAVARSRAARQYVKGYRNPARLCWRGGANEYEANFRVKSKNGFVMRTVLIPKMHLIDRSKYRPHYGSKQLEKARRRA